MTEADTNPPLAAPEVSLPDHALSLPALSLSGNAGRVAGLRDKIMDSGVIDALIEFVEGRRELSSDQVAAGLALARKIVPDLANMPLPHSDEDNDGKDASSEIEIHIVDPKA